MASTNKTTHLNLNQWIGTDPVLRSDFNVDNVKLDAAINDRALLRLDGKTLTTAAASLALDLSYTDLTGYGQLQLCLLPVLSGGGTVSLQVNQTTVSLASLTASGPQGVILSLCLLPGGIAGWWFAPGGTGTASGAFQVSGVTAETITSLALTCSAAFQSGTACTLYGVKK